MSTQSQPTITHPNTHKHVILQQAVMNRELFYAKHHFDMSLINLLNKQLCGSRSVVHSHKPISQGQTSCISVWFVLKWPSAAMAPSFTYFISLLYLSLSPHTQNTIWVAFDKLMFPAGGVLCSQDIYGQHRKIGWLWIRTLQPHKHTLACVCVIESDRPGKNICPRFSVLDVLLCDVLLKRGWICWETQLDALSLSLSLLLL